MDNKDLVLVIYSRPECHLCEQLLQALRPWQTRYGFDIEVVDISQDKELTARYAARIPVLVGGEQELGEYFLDETKLQAYLEQITNTDKL